MLASRPSIAQSANTIDARSDAQAAQALYHALHPAGVSLSGQDILDNLPSRFPPMPDTRKIISHHIIVSCWLSNIGRRDVCRIKTKKTSWDDLPFELKSLVISHALRGSIARGLKKLALVTRRSRIAYRAAWRPEWSWLHLDICNVAFALPEMNAEVIMMLRQLTRRNCLAYQNVKDEEWLLLTTSLHYMWDCRRLMWRDLELGLHLNGEWLRRALDRTEEQQRWEDIYGEEERRKAYSGD